MNYKATFNGFNPAIGADTCIEYELKLIKDSSSSVYTEIELSGDNPCRLTYNTSETPFDAIRASYLTISVVADSYLEDILPSTPKEVKVTLTNKTNNIVVFTGWLRPFVLSADYRDEYETFDIYADDCIGILKYYPFEPKTSGTTTIVSFHDILVQICETGENLKGFYWSRTKYKGNTVILPTHLEISEKNFYYDDVDETLKLDEVLEEIGKFIGFTVLQEGEYMYLIDYQALKSNNSLYMTSYLKSSGWNSGSNTYKGGTTALSQEYVTGSNPQITIEPIKNKIEVRDNYYNVEYFIPSPFDDELLTNRYSPIGDNYNFNYSVEVPSVAGYAHYRNGRRSKGEDVRDDDYQYFHRVYDHKYWESIYSGGTYQYPYQYRTMVGGTIIDHGHAKKDYKSEYGQNIVTSSVDWKRYIMISQQNYGRPMMGWTLWEQMVMPNQPPLDYPVFRLKPGYSVDFLFSEDSYLVINGSIKFEKYKDRPYINPEWVSDSPKWVSFFAHGTSIMSFGYMAFKLGIGGKWWNGSGWTTTEQGFWVAPEKTQDGYAQYNTDSSILNNIRWDLYIGADGYKIPLAGVDTTQEITFEILLPSLQFVNEDEPEYNGFAYISDLSFKVYRQGESESDNDTENDFVETNVISSGSVIDMSSIELKITTAGKGSKPSWSDCIYAYSGNRVLLDTVREPNISGNTAMRPEQNIVKKYVDQYSTMTKKISIDIPSSFSQITRFENLDVDNPNDKYVVLGSEIDFANGSQRITAIKKN